MSKKYLFAILAGGLLMSTLGAASAYAQTNQRVNFRGGVRGEGRLHVKRTPGIFGTVAAVNGTTLTVNGNSKPNEKTGSSTTTYSVDASNAAVIKNGASSTVSDIIAGDTVAIQGTINGSNVTATLIRDGASGWKTRQNPAIQGNGQPVVGGNVASISGATLTVTNKSNVTYTIDASGASIVKSGASSSLLSVAVGDGVIVQGTVNGASVTASSVIDNGAGPASLGNSPGRHLGFFSFIGNFFAHLFGF